MPFSPMPFPFMPSPLTIAVETPPSVWAVLAYLLWQGARSLRTRSQSLWRLLAVPSVFAAYGLATMPRSGGVASVVPWLAAALVAAPLGGLTAPRILARGPGRFAVTRRGSPVPLVRNLLVFGAHYGLAVAAALHWRAPDVLSALGGIVSGATVGYVVGMGLVTGRDWRAAPRAVPQSVITSAQ